MEIGALGSLANNTQSVASVNTQSAPVQPISSTTSAPVQTANAVQQTAPTPSLEQLKQAVEEINKSSQYSSRGLRFSVDDERTIVKVIDTKTEEVIRQIPSEETIAISKALDQVIGNLIKEKG